MTATAPDADGVSLDEWMDATTPAFDDTPERFAIEADAQADWAIRKLKQANERIEQAETDAKDWRKKIDTWLAKRTAADRDTAGTMERLLVDYHRRLLEAAMEAGVPEREWPKSWPLPNGTLWSRAGSVSVEVTNEDDLLAWLWTYRPELVKVEPKRGEVKQAFQPVWVDADRDNPVPDGVEAVAALVTEDGEAVPGVRLVRGARSYTPKPS